MKKILKSTIFMFAILLVLTGCGNNSTTIKTKEKSKGKCDVVECINKLDAKMSYEDINKVIGFKGKLSSEDEDYKVYDWDLTDDTSISAQFMLETGNVVIDASFPDSLITKKADFSKYDQIKTKINNGETITYNEVVKLFGNVEGILTKIDSDTSTYKWVNKDGGYLSGYFDTKTKKCTMVTGAF